MARRTTVAGKTKGHSHFVMDEFTQLIVEDDAAVPTAYPLKSASVADWGSRQANAETTMPTRLPTDGIEAYAPGGAWEALGIVVGDVDRDDDMFTFVTLPEGWTIKPSKHSMYTDILDEKGRQRISYFHKVAAYDCKADIRSPNNRYRTMPGKASSWDPSTAYRETIVIDCVLATYNASGEVCDEAIVHSIGRKVESGEKSYAVHEEIEAAAKAWLNENFPKNSDPLAYWD